MELVIMIRVNISSYRRELVRSYYHDNSLIKYTETRSLVQKPTAWLGSSRLEEICVYTENYGLK